MALEFLSDQKTYQAVGKYLYSGAFNGFLATGGLFFYTAFMLLWPITTTFTVVFAVTTTITTLAAIYLLYRDDSRRDYLNAMNGKAKRIKELFDELHYYEDKLLREQALLQSPESDSNTHKCISKDDLEIIRRKIAELKELYNDDEDSLPKVREKAIKYSGRFIQRHIIGTYKAFITSYVFYLSFPLFIALAINAIIAPAWIAPLAIPILVFSVSLGVFGLFKSYLDESREITTYDAAIKESEWIENSAKKMAKSCEALLTNQQTIEKRVAVERKPDLEINRKNSEKKSSKYFLIKKGQELLARIPVLNALTKPLGERLTKTAFDTSSPETSGKQFGRILQQISEYFYEWTLLSTVVDYAARVLFMAIMGAIVPGGVALYLKFVLGVTFTPLLVNVYAIGLIITTALSVVFSLFNLYWNHQETLLKTYSDHVTALTTEVTEDLKQLHKERSALNTLKANGAEAEHATPVNVIDKNSRKLILQRKVQLEKAARKLREQSDKMNEDNFFMSFVKWLGIVYNSLTTGYAWYMGFPLFVFLTLVTFVPITAPIITYGLFMASLLVGVFGVIYTFDAADQGVEFANTTINEAKTQSEAAENLLTHFDKLLNNKDLSVGESIKYSESNETKLITTPPKNRKEIALPDDYSANKKFQLLQGLRKPERPKHLNISVSDPIFIGELNNQLGMR